MMTRLTYSLFFILLFSATLVFGQATPIDGSAAVTLRIDPENARGAAVSQIFQEVEFIPLETTTESTFGRINQLKVTDHHFIVYDADTRAVLIFTKSGKFVAKINAAMMKSDENDKEVVSFYGFQLVKNNAQDQIFIMGAKNSFYFDLAGKLLLRKPSKEIKYDSTRSFTDTTYKIFPRKLKVNGKDSTFYDISLLKNGKETANYFPFKGNRHQEDELIVSGANRDGIFDYGKPNEFFYLHFYDFNIYKIEPEKLSIAYRIILPAANSLPKDFMTNASYKNKRFEFFQKNQQIPYGLTDTYQLNDLLFFKLPVMVLKKNAKSSLIYNLVSGELSAIENIEPDTLSYHLPITDAGAYYDFLLSGMLAFVNNNFYTSYSSLAMFTFKEQSAGKKPIYNTVLSDYFKTQSKKSNPVLIRLKPKV